MAHLVVPLIVKNSIRQLEIGKTAKYRNSQENSTGEGKREN